MLSNGFGKKPKEQKLFFDHFMLRILQLTFHNNEEKTYLKF